MKSILFVLTFSSSLAYAAPLTPVSTSQRPCTATITDAVYNVEAACWTNKDKQQRIWFKEATVAALKETGINTRYIRGLEAACATAPQYTYEELLGPDKKAEEEIATKAVNIEFSHLDTSACFPK